MLKTVVSRLQVPFNLCSEGAAEASAVGTGQSANAAKLLEAQVDKKHGLRSALYSKNSKSRSGKHGKKLNHSLSF